MNKTKEEALFPQDTDEGLPTLQGLPMITCATCGAQVSPDDKVCPNCGERFEEDSKEER